MTEHDNGGAGTVDVPAETVEVPAETLDVQAETVEVRRGMFNNYAIVQGVDHVVPVDMYLPGCPPRPEMLIDAILKLHEQIGSSPLGVNRVNAAREAETAALTAKPTAQMKGLLR